ncbi:MAG: response regulator transcription factor [Oscillochloridaceae bacterium]|nr:response regulator transcription factor [Chloroflexaceae bacterium]MDW8388913.1 response regulator transcription factor [Oscillochloridaceae bacterium]
MNKPRILLVEEDQNLRAALDSQLRARGHAIVATGSAEQAMELLRSESFTLLMTEVALDTGDGIALMAAARRLHPDLELIVLTGAATLESAIAALNLGARAYLRKPFTFDLVERYVERALEHWRSRSAHHAALRHLGATLLRIAELHDNPYEVSEPREAPLRIGALQIDPRRRRATLGNRVLPLTSGEFDLLLYLAHRNGEVLSPERLARDVLGYHCAPDEARELIKARVHRLRAKLEPNPRAPTFLVSVRGAGYMLTSGEEH